MRITTTLFAAAIVALTASSANAATNSSSCSDRYGHYGYSAAYCAHDLYGRSSPPDRFQSDSDARDRALISQLPDRERYAFTYPEDGTRDRDESAKQPDQPDRDRG